MRVVLGSENQPKLRSVEAAFGTVFQELVTVETSPAASDVSAHPTSAEESLTGAINRAHNARLLSPGADYYVGIEGGFIRVEERTWEIGWVAISNADNVVHTAPSAGVEIGGQILKAILDGQELNDVLANRFNIDHAGNTNGYYGLVTDNQLTREQCYVNAVIFALAPFKHPEYYS